LARYIYQVQSAQTSASPTGNTPVFAGNMNQYRMDNKTMAADIELLETATTLLNDQEPGGLPANYIVTFQQDKAVFFGPSTTNAVITFSFVGAVPGTVVRLKWTWGAALGLTVTAPAGSTVIKDNGDLTQAANNTNIMYCLYCGLNAAGNPEVSYSFIQAS